ncbi:DUF6789 family protein [Microvirga splendida]|uniref:DUF2938 domain-containing protein n=1 Tax=Microvirga splendida TaxID=2795727 RepID=A0ABS0Y546_9HYPH|nr:DUF6789 family protein [Microvirga splendida]MBJ6127416.1 hypothetical protein [Microvirga splendida]
MSCTEKGVLAGLAATTVLGLVMLLNEMTSFMPNTSVFDIMAGVMGGSRATAWLIRYLSGALLWGVLFAWLSPYLPGTQYWIRGAAFGIGVWLLMMFIIMPAASLGLFGIGKGAFSPTLTLFLHLIWGAVLGATYGWLLNPLEEATSRNRLTNTTDAQ